METFRGISIPPSYNTLLTYYAKKIPLTPRSILKEKLSKFNFVKSYGFLNELTNGVHIYSTRFLPIIFLNLDDADFSMFE